MTTSRQGLGHDPNCQTIRSCPAPAVSLRSVTVSYREHIALRDVTLDIGRDDFCGVIGPNGAGKTTLLTIINGLGRIHTGTVDVLGQRATGTNFGRLRRRIGYVAQQERVVRVDDVGSAD